MFLFLCHVSVFMRLSLGIIGQGSLEHGSHLLALDWPPVCLDKKCKPAHDIPFLNSFPGWAKKDVALIGEQRMGMKASSTWTLPWILNQQPQDSPQLLSTLSVFTLFLLSPLDIYMFTWEWSRKTLLASRCTWMGQATLRVASQFSVPVLGF